VIKKEGHGQTKELLQLFDIRGTSVTRIHASKDFKKFVTIDDAGIVYILEEIPSSFVNNSENITSQAGLKSDDAAAHIMRKPTDL
jgi:hypothetical protein